jgi:hypothetical protein
MQRLIEPESRGSREASLLRERSEFLTGLEPEQVLERHEEPVASLTESKGFWASVLGENPVLHKELRSIFFPAKQTVEQRKMQQIVGITTMITIYAAILIGMREILKGQPVESHAMTWYVLYGILLGVQAIILLIAPLSRLPTTIAREREKQTWNALLLSRLSPETILSGKYTAGVVSSLAAMLFFLPLMIHAAVMGGVSAIAVGTGIAVLIAMTILLSMTSIYASWRQETTVKANNEAGLWMLGLVFGAAGIWGLGTLIWGTVSYFLTGTFNTPMPDPLQTILKLPALLNPFVELVLATVPYDRNLPFTPLVQRLLPLIFLLFSAGLSVRLWKKMVKNFWDAPRDFSG